MAEDESWLATLQTKAAAAAARHALESIGDAIATDLERLLLPDGPPPDEPPPARPAADPEARAAAKAAALERAKAELAEMKQKLGKSPK
jgi:hypothetical protein